MISEMAARPAPDEAGAPVRLSTWLVLLLLTLVNTMNSIDRVIVNILVEPIRREFGFTDTQIGVVAGLGFALFYGLLGLPIARLADRYSRKRLLAVGLATWSALTVLTGRAVGFWSMLFARFGVGVGEATCYPASLSLIGDYFRPSRRPLAVSLFQIGLDLGFIIGAPVAGIVAARHGWRAAFTLVGLPGLVLALVLLVAMHEPARGEQEGAATAIPRPAAASGSVWGALRRLLGGDPVFVALVGAAMFMALGSATMALWGAAFMIRSHGLTEEQVGITLGPVLGLSGFAGTILGGVIGSWLAHRDNRTFAPLRVMLFAILIAVPGMVVLLLAPTTPLAIAGGVAGGFFTGMHYGPLIATTINRVAPGDRGIASSLLVIGQSVIGFGLGPLIVGAISDSLAPRLGSDALRYAMLFAPVCLSLGWLCALAAWRGLNAGTRETGAIV